MMKEKTMKKTLQATIIVMSTLLSMSLTANARGFDQPQTSQNYGEVRGRNNQFENSNRNRVATPNGAFQQGGTKTPTNDQDIVRAVESRRNVNFVEGGGMIVNEVLPDDNQGLRHQKFVVQLSNGSKMLAVYNLDMDNCNPIPLQKGDTVAMGGEFKWTNQGPLLHWLHYDPSNRRPDGYVQHEGVDYCRSGRRQ
jgi:hypothetical protein